MANQSTPASAGPYAGFDTALYPGDHTMELWKRASPYSFAGYYLRAPCHRFATWIGHRPALAAMGWNLVPIYVGQQPPGVSPCSSSILSAAQGRIDALDCRAQMTAEKFLAGTFVFLDVEHCDSFPAGLHDYIASWMATLVEGGFGPAVYCHAHNAADVRAAVQAGLSGATASPPIVPRFWIAGGVVEKFNLASSHPADSGIAFAELWQCPRSITRTFAGLAINVDEDCSTLRDPSAPAR